MKNEKSFLALLEASIKDHWDFPALTDYKGKTYYYKDVAAKIAGMHLIFEQYGLSKGDKVALIGRNQARWGITFFAILSYGAVAVPILSDFKIENVRSIINHSEAKILVTSDVSLDSLLSEEIPMLRTVILMEDFSILKAVQTIGNLKRLFIERYPQGFLKKNVSYHKDQQEELAILNYTSGTTGASKGVMLPYRAIWSNARFALDIFPDLKPGDNVLSILPMAHMYGMMIEFIFEMVRGCHIHFLGKTPTPKVIMEAFSSVKPRLIIAVPLIIEKIYKRQILPALETPSVRIMLKIPLLNKIVYKKIYRKLNEAFGGNFLQIVVGGAAFNPEVETFFKKIKFPFTVGYGMTECAPLITYEDWEQIPLYSCGKAVHRMEVRIDSPNPEIVVGEIQTRGDNVMLGYYKNEKDTSAIFIDGWLKTGDLGLMDKNGYVSIKGRSKNMILGPSGQNIYPEEIENVLNNMPYVMESLVIEDDGRLVALVFPDYDLAKGSDLDEIMKTNLGDLNKQLPNYCQISKIEVRKEEFEKTPKRSIKRFLYQRQ